MIDGNRGYQEYRGRIIAPGITMPAQGIHDYDVYVDYDAFELGLSDYTAESLEDAKHWVDVQEEGPPLEKRGGLKITKIYFPVVTVIRIDDGITQHYYTSTEPGVIHPSYDVIETEATWQEALAEAKAKGARVEVEEF